MKDNIKPVWRLNTGRGVPSDLGEEYVYFGGDFYQVSHFDTLGNILWSLEDEPFLYDIYAYETNRTKPAKYRKVKCSCERGKKLDFNTLNSGMIKYKRCNDCNGTGHVWEAI